MSGVRPRQPSRSPQRSFVPPMSTRGTSRGSMRGRTLPSRSMQPHPADEQIERKASPERTVHVGDGYHMFTPSPTKREQIKRQAEAEQQQYEAHIERTRLRGIHEVHRLGGAALSEEEVRRQQAEKYRREKYERVVRHSARQTPSTRKNEEARQQTVTTERTQGTPADHQATGWTDETREQDRRETMDRFLNRLTVKYNGMTVDPNPTDQKGVSHRDKLPVVREMFPHMNDETLEYYLEVYNGNIDAIAHELAG